MTRRRLERAAITEIARGFMRDLPDMIVNFDKLEPRGDATAFHWTLIGTNTGPGGTENRVRISVYEDNYARILRASL